MIVCPSCWSEPIDIYTAIDLDLYEPGGAPEPNVTFQCNCCRLEYVNGHFQFDVTQYDPKFGGLTRLVVIGGTLHVYERLDKEYCIGQYRNKKRAAVVEKYMRPFVVQSVMEQ